MTDRFITSPEIERYSTEHTGSVPDWLQRVEAETRRDYGSLAGMLTGRLEGRFLRSLAHMVNARRILEIGTFTGYSALSMAEGMAADGTIVTCELNPKHAETARRHIVASPYAGHIEVRLGPALQTIRGLAGPFDLVFIDADKSGYAAYVDETLPKLAPNGVIALDNMLRTGRVLDADADADTRAIHELNRRLADDARLEVVLLPVRDGVTLVQRRRQSS